MQWFGVLSGRFAASKPGLFVGLCVCVGGVNTTAKHGISKHGLVVRVENVQREQRALVSLYMVLSTSHKTDSDVFNYV